MTVNDFAMPQFPLVQLQLASEIVSKPTTERPGSGAKACSADSAESMRSSIAHEMFAVEGDRFNRRARGLGKLFKVKKTPDLPGTAKAADAPNAPKTGPSGASVGAAKIEQEIATDIASYKPKDNFASKLGGQQVVDAPPKTFTTTLEISPSTVNGKAVEDFSSRNLAKADTELAEAVAESKADVTPAVKKLTDTKKALLTAGAVAVVGSVGTLATKLIEKAFTDSPAAVIKKGFFETRIVDQVQENVFAATNMLGRITGIGVDAVQSNLAWAIKTNEERMTCLESLTIALQKDVEGLAKEYGIPCSISKARNEDPDLEVRAKVIDSRLAVITAIGQAVALKLKATA